MAGKDVSVPRSGAPTLSDIAERLATLERTCENILQLVKSVVELMMPKTGDKGQALAELIAIMVGLQREQGQLLRLTQADTERILNLLPGALDDANGHQNGARRSRP